MLYDYCLYRLFEFFVVQFFLNRKNLLISFEHAFLSLLHFEYFVAPPELVPIVTATRQHSIQYSKKCQFDTVTWQNKIFVVFFKAIKYCRTEKNPVGNKIVCVTEIRVIIVYLFACAFPWRVHFLNDGHTTKTGHVECINKELTSAVKIGWYFTTWI